MNFFSQEVDARRLGLLHELVPKAVRVAVLANPSSTTAQTTLRYVQEAARVVGLQIRVLNATTIDEIDAAFATLTRERPDALFVVPTASSPAAACKLSPWRRAIGFRRHILTVIMSRPAGS
jgi:ABC-type uncharacterized transport system substrate-binding protein